jgi:hypothetical protein
MSATGELGNKPSGWWYLLAGALVVAAFAAALTIVSTASALTSVSSPQFFALHGGVGAAQISKPANYGVFINGAPDGRTVSVTGPQGTSVQITNESVSGAFPIDGHARRLIAIFSAKRTGQYRFQLTDGGNITMIIGRLQLTGLARRASIAALVWIGLMLCGLAVWIVTLTRRIGWQRRANRSGGY